MVIILKHFTSPGKDGSRTHLHAPISTSCHLVYWNCEAIPYGIQLTPFNLCNSFIYPFQLPVHLLRLVCEAPS